MYDVVNAILLIYSLVNVCGATVLEPQQQRIQAANFEFDSAFDAFVEDTLEDWHVPGLSIAVIDNGKVFSKVLYHSTRIKCPIHVHHSLPFEIVAGIC